MHLTILYCMYIWSNAHHYALALVETFFFFCLDGTTSALIMSLFVSVTGNYTSFSLDPTLKRSEMTEHLRRDDDNPSEDLRGCQKAFIPCKAALQRLYRKKRYTNNLELNWISWCVAGILVQYGCRRIIQVDIALVVDEETSPLLCKALRVPRKALYNCNKLLL